MEIELDFGPADFPDFFEGWGDTHFTNTLKDGVKSGLNRVFQRDLSTDLLKLKIDDKMNITCFRKGSYSNGISLKHIRDIGDFYISGLKIEFDVVKDRPLSDLNLVCSLGARLDHWFPDADPAPLVKVKPMKKWDRVTLRFGYLVIPKGALPVDYSIIDQCTCNADTLLPVYQATMLHFQCFVCAKKYICECFRGIAEHSIARPNFNNGPFTDLVSQTTYKAEICHLCRGVPSTTGAYERGKSEVRSYYHSYLHAFAMGNGFDWRAAESLIRDRLGIPHIGEGWIAEANMLRIVRSLFPDVDVLHQASPDWLGRQRFDIYIPDYGLAVEYNGEQHYFPIEHFGGDKGFLATVQRDEDKRQKAVGAGVTMIEFAYDDDLSPEAVFLRLKPFAKIQKRQGI